MLARKGDLFSFSDVEMAIKMTAVVALILSHGGCWGRLSGLKAQMHIVKWTLGICSKLQLLV